MHLSHTQPGSKRLGRPMTRYPGSPRAIMDGIHSDPLHFLLDATAAHGDPLMFDVVVRKLVLVNSPEHIHHLLVANRANYIKATRGYAAMRMVLGQGLVTSMGSFWKRQRRIAQPAFHRRRLAGLADIMVANTEAMLERWRPKVGTGTPVDISVEMTRLTMEIVCETLLGVEGRSDDAERLAEAIEIATEHIVHRTRSWLTIPEFIPTARNRRFQEALAVLNTIVLGIIEERRRSPDARHHNDLLAMFMEAQDEDTGERMTARQLRDEVMTMFLAGHETTAMSLTWTLYLLSQHPRVMVRLCEELETVLGGRKPTFADLKALSYLEQVLKESMRLYPPVPMMARHAVEEDVLDGYHVPAGAYMLLCPYTAHSNPALWPQPTRLDPDRFAPNNKEAVP
ncbi:MAG: cytochrome P450, partial [Myxococcota bacterium]